MSYNGNGVFLINTPGQPVVSGTTITSTAFNALTTDLASGLTNAITKDGQTNITANIPMSNFKITGLGAGTNPNDAVRLAQIQDGIINGRFVNLEYTGTFTGGTGVVNLGSGQFYKDASGNVGIGTASPSYQLNTTKAGGSGDAGQLVRFTNTSTGNSLGPFHLTIGTANYFANSPGIVLAGTNGISFAVGDGSDLAAQRKLTIDSSGNVGIGTSTLLSGSKFDVNGRGRFFQDAAATTGAVIIRQDITNTVGGYLQWVNNDNTAQTGYVAVLPNSTFVFGAAASERMRISAVGDVGIGTASPVYTLDVQAPTGSISASSTTGTNFSKVQVNNTGGSFQLAIDNSTGSNYGSTVAYARCVWNDSTTAPTLFYTNFAERMRIDASGNVSIKVTSAIGRFNVQSDDSATAIAAGNASGTAAYNGALFYNNGFTSLVGQISISGSTASYLSVSDYRLKESVAPMTGALATVAQLKPVTYKWKSDGSDGQGFIAHELQAVVPDCVTGTKDAVDAEGKPKYQGVDTSFLVATLTAAIQEQQAIISAMETRLAALEA